MAINFIKEKPLKAGLGALQTSGHIHQSNVAKLWGYNFFDKSLMNKSARYLDVYYEGFLLSRFEYFFKPFLMHDVASFW